MPQELSPTWFSPLIEGDDLYALSRIADQCVWRLSEFMKECELFDLLRERNVRITEEDLNGLYVEADQGLNEATMLIRDRVGIRPRPADIELYVQRQREAGLGRKSLLVKLNVVKELWKRLTDAVKKSGKSLADNLRKGVQQVWKALRAFLSYLNKLMASIKHVLPPMEAVKELKDVIEASLDLFDDARELAHD